MNNNRLKLEDINRLQEIKEEIKELLGEAEGILSNTDQYDRAKGYWMADIRISLDSDHTYLSRAMCTMQDTIDAFLDEEETAS